MCGTPAPRVVADHRPAGSTYALVSSANTFTQPNTFTASGAGAATAAVQIVAAAPFLRYTETDQAADMKGWSFGASAGVMRMGPVADAGVVSATQGIAMTQQRHGVE